MLFRTSVCGGNHFDLLLMNIHHHLCRCMEACLFQRKKLLHLCLHIGGVDHSRVDDIHFIQFAASNSCRSSSLRSPWPGALSGFCTVNRKFSIHIHIFLSRNTAFPPRPIQRAGGCASFSDTFFRYLKHIVIVSAGKTFVCRNYDVACSSFLFWYGSTARSK